MVLVVTFVVDVIISERHIADCKVEGVVQVPRILETLNIYLGVRINRLCNATGQRIKLDAVKMTAIFHFVGHIPEKTAHAH